jgi:hypothetical protein
MSVSWRNFGRDKETGKRMTQSHTEIYSTKEKAATYKDYNYILRLELVEIVHCLRI